MLLTKAQDMDDSLLPKYSRCPCNRDSEILMATTLAVEAVISKACCCRKATSLGTKTSFYHWCHLLTKRRGFKRIIDEPAERSALVSSSVLLITLYCQLVLFQLATIVFSTSNGPEESFLAPLATSPRSVGNAFAQSILFFQTGFELGSLIQCRPLGLALL